MPLKYSVYGSCQACWGVNSVLKTCKEFTDVYGTCVIKPSFEMSDAEMSAYLTDVCPYLDLFIYLPISDDLGCRATSNIIKHLPATCKKIVFPRCYFSAYNPDCRYVKDSKCKHILAPDIYHNMELVTAYQQNDLNAFREIAFSEDYYSPEFLEKLAQYDIDMMMKREAQLQQTVDDKTTVIPVAEYIRDNFRDKHLFSTFNHPTHHLHQHIVNGILEVLNITDRTIDLNIDPLAKSQLPIFESVYRGLRLNFRKPVFAKVLKKDYTCDEYIELVRNEYDKIDTTKINTRRDAYRALLQNLSDTTTEPTTEPISQ